MAEKEKEAREKLPDFQHIPLQQQVDMSDFVYEHKAPPSFKPVEISEDQEQSALLEEKKNDGNP